MTCSPICNVELLGADNSEPKCSVFLNNSPHRVNTVTLPSFTENVSLMAAYSHTQDC